MKVLLLNCRGWVQSIAILGSLNGSILDILFWRLIQVLFILLKNIACVLALTIIISKLFPWTSLFFILIFTKLKLVNYLLGIILKICHFIYFAIRNVMLLVTVQVFIELQGFFIGLIRVHLGNLLNRLRYNFVNLK